MEAARYVLMHINVNTFEELLKKGMISKCGTVFTNWRPKKIIRQIDFIIAFHEFLF